MYLIAITFVVLLSQKKISLKYASVLVFPLIYSVFALFMYGQILPQSVAAKQAFQELGLSPYSQFSSMGIQLNRFEILAGLWNILLKPVLLMNAEAGITLMDLPRKPGNFLFSGGDNILFIILAATIYLAWKDIQIRKLLHLPLIGYVYFLFIFIIIIKQIEFWYIPVWNTSALILILLGIYLFLNDAFTALIRSPQINKVLTVSIFSVISLLMIGKSAFIVNDGKRPYDEYRGIIYSSAWRDSDEFERYLGYRYSAEKLNEIKPHGTLMTNEVGILGFFYKGSVIDTFGLCSREVIDFYMNENKAGRNGRSLESLASHFQPDFIVHGVNENDIEPVLKTGYVINEKTDYKIFGSPLFILSKNSY